MVKKLLFIFVFTISTTLCSQVKTIDKITVSPNPFSNQTTLQFHSNQPKGNIIFVVKNVLGKTVFKKTYQLKLGKNQIKFEKGDLNSGMYIYSLQTSKSIVSKRFVIK